MVPNIIARINYDKSLNNDEFLSLPHSTQALYFHLSYRANINGYLFPESIIEQVNCTMDDYDRLVEKGFVESGVALDSRLG